MERYTERPCGCGSGQDHFPLLDGHGCFLCYACDKCEPEKLKRYRPDIMERYECDEPIEPEDY